MSREWKAELEAQLDSIPKGWEINQRLILVALTACTQGQDRPVSELHDELAALAGLGLSDYFTGLLKLKFAGFIMDEGQGLRKIDLRPTTNRSSKRQSCRVVACSSRSAR